MILWNRSWLLVGGSLICRLYKEYNGFLIDYVYLAFWLLPHFEEKLVAAEHCILEKYPAIYLKLELNYLSVEKFLDLWHHCINVIHCEKRINLKLFIFGEISIQTRLGRWLMNWRRLWKCWIWSRNRINRWWRRLRSW